MSDIAILAKGFAIALPVIMTAMNMVPIADRAAEIAVKTVKTALIGVIGFLNTEMPFADQRGCIIEPAQIIRQCIEV